MWSWAVFALSTLGGAVPADGGPQVEPARPVVECHDSDARTLRISIDADFQVQLDAAGEVSRTRLVGVSSVADAHHPGYTISLANGEVWTIREADADPNPDGGAASAATQLDVSFSALSFDCDLRPGQGQLDRPRLDALAAATHALSGPREVSNTKAGVLSAQSGLKAGTAVLSLAPDEKNGDSSYLFVAEAVKVDAKGVWHLSGLGAHCVSAAGRHCGAAKEVLLTPGKKGHPATLLARDDNGMEPMKVELPLKSDGVEVIRKLLGGPAAK